MRVAIIGAGHVGSTAAYALMLRALFREIVLIDANDTLASAEAADLSDATALAHPTSIWAGTYEDAASAYIALITAGTPTHGSETRISVAARSALIVARCVNNLMSSGFAGIVVVAANPVDLMTSVVLRQSGLPPSRVIGTGTLLDTSRLQQMLASALHVAPSAIGALVVGEHGDSEVIAFSSLRIGGLTVAEFASPLEEPDQLRLAKSLREAAYQIIQGKGYTSFGIATSVVRICEAIVRDERSVLPVSSLLSGQFGIQDICLSLPCILGREGRIRVLQPDLAELEMTELRASAAVLQGALAALPWPLISPAAMPASSPT